MNCLKYSNEKQGHKLVGVFGWGAAVSPVRTLEARLEARLEAQSRAPLGVGGRKQLLLCYGSEATGLRGCLFFC